MKVIRKKVWDLFVRAFHWALVVSIAANVLIIDGENRFHRWVGYFVIMLVLARILWGVFGKGYARFATFRPSIGGSLEQLHDMLANRQTVHLGHTPLGALMIYNLLATILVIGLSGFLMTTDMFWGVEWPEELHVAAVRWVEISVAMHVAAVILESWRMRVNLPAAMLSGYKTLPANNANLRCRADD
jgi:cytochrome b